MLHRAYGIKSDFQPPLHGVHRINFQNPTPSMMHTYYVDSGWTLNCGQAWTMEGILIYCDIIISFLISGIGRPITWLNSVHNLTHSV